MGTLKTNEEIKKEISETMEELSWVVEGGDAHDLQDACDKAHACLADTLALIERLESDASFYKNISALMDKTNKEALSLIDSLIESNLKRGEKIEQLKAQNAELSKNIMWMEAERDDLKRYIQQLEAQNAELSGKIGQLQAERDAAVEDMATAVVNNCDVCMHNEEDIETAPCNSCMHIFKGRESKFKWRGVQKEGKES